MWIMGVVLAVMALVLVLYSMQAQPLYRAMQEWLDRLNGIMQENLAGVRVVKAFARGGYEIERFGQRNKDLKDAAKEAVKSDISCKMSGVGTLWRT